MNSTKNTETTNHETFHFPTLIFCFTTTLATIFHTHSIYIPPPAPSILSAYSFLWKIYRVKFQWFRSYSPIYQYNVRFRLVVQCNQQFRWYTLQYRRQSLMWIWNITNWNSHKMCTAVLFVLLLVCAYRQSPTITSIKVHTNNFD